jgi:GAF domain-containing protein
VSQPPLERDRVRLESDTLYAVIAAVSSSADLDRVLGAIVELLTRATDCHACLVYLRDGERLRMRAASRIYANLIGRIELRLDEGLTGWVARHNEPAFIRDNALDDPRTKYVPELEEERFQSICAVPVPARSGDVLGVIVLHTAAPREFDEGVLSFLAHTASVVAGAIENARLLEDSRRRVEMLTGLATLSQDVAAAPRREDLYRVGTGSVRRLLQADACRLYRLDPESGELELAAADPAGDDVPLSGSAAGVLLEVLRRPSRRPSGVPGADDELSLLAAPLAVGDEDLGVLTVASRERDAFGDRDDELLRTAANQVALALKRTELIERLTAENITRDLFDALAAGAGAVAEARARTAGFDLTRRHAVLHMVPGELGDGGPAWPILAERIESRVRRLCAGAVCDHGRQTLRALVVLDGRPEEPQELQRDLAELGAAENVHIGMSETRRGPGEGARSLSEAADAARVARALAPAGGAFAYSELGAYRYLIRLPLDEMARDLHSEAIERLAEYDRRRRARLVDTLEEYLHSRGSTAGTARKLYVHPNTLRQRLDRIEKITGLDLDDEDLLSLELAIKLVRLRGA